VIDRFHHPRHLLWTVNMHGEDAVLVESTVRLAKLVFEHSENFADKWGTEYNS
jgi:hypothetical protein